MNLFVKHLLLDIVLILNEKGSNGFWKCCLPSIVRSSSKPVLDNSRSWKILKTIRNWFFKSSIYIYYFATWFNDESYLIAVMRSPFFGHLVPSKDGPIFDPGTYWPNPKRFFWPKRKKNEKFGIFRGNFPNPDPNQRCLTLPYPSNKKIDPTRVKKICPGPITSAKASSS